MITPKRAKAVCDAGYTSVKIRTMLTCKSGVGACAKCYGSNMATGQAVQVGEAVGIIAAQSIGEPGTQLTMRTFHAGGVAGDDITQGLPRVEELFEARKPKGLAIIAEFGGEVQLKDTKKKREVIITNRETGDVKTYLIPYGSRLKVQEGQILEAGDELTEGSINPHDLLRIKGIRAVQDYMIREVQRVYRLQGVDINDKHVEVIVRQMLKKVRIEDGGDTGYLPGAMVDVLELEKRNKQMEEQGEVQIEEVHMMEGKASVKGLLHFQILYASDGDIPVSEMTGTIPFEETISLPQAKAEDEISVQAEIGDLKSELINSRKLGMKAIVVLNVTAGSVCDGEGAIDIEGGEDIYTKKRTAEVSYLVFSKKDTLRVRDEWKIPGTKDAMQRILYSDVCIGELNTRMEEEKLLVEGHANIFVI